MLFNNNNNNKKKATTKKSSSSVVSSSIFSISRSIKSSSSSSSSLSSSSSSSLSSSLDCCILLGGRSCCNNSNNNNNTTITNHNISNRRGFQEGNNNKGGAVEQSFFRRYKMLYYMTGISCILFFGIVAVLNLEHATTSLFVLATSSSSSLSPPPVSMMLTESKIRELITELKGNDERMVRWDITEHTYSKQHDPNGPCQYMIDAFKVLQGNDDGNTTTTTTNNNAESDDEYKGLICEYMTFCITDNPNNRAIFSEQQPNVHQNIVNIIERSTTTVAASSSSNNNKKKKNVRTSAKCMHLIYIATFANTMNHQTFHQVGAVQILANIIKMSQPPPPPPPAQDDDDDDDENDEEEGDSNNNNKKKDEMAKEETTTTTTIKIEPIQVMWAAAALQNMAASYCDTPDDGRCYWSWYRGREHKDIHPQSKPLLSDGTGVRQDIYNDKELMQRIIEWTCIGPVVHAGDDEEQSGDEYNHHHPYPGENAIDIIHDRNIHIVPWSTAGVLKNVVLLPEAKQYIDNDNNHHRAMECLCYMQHSHDWLESAKAADTISFIRHDDPCWFGDESGDEDIPDGELFCIDDIFFDDEEYTCTDYGDATHEECNTSNKYGVKPITTCCPCGGGRRRRTTTRSNNEKENNNKNNNNMRKQEL